MFREEFVVKKGFDEHLVFFSRKTPETNALVTIASGEVNTIDHILFESSALIKSKENIFHTL